MYRVFTSSSGVYKGAGNHSKVLTEQEEYAIARTALQKTDDGKDLSWSRLTEIMMTEMDVLRSKHPSRDMCKVSSTMGSLLNKSYVRRFAQRNGLSVHLLKRFTVPTRPYECEKCGLAFSFRNALVSHMKTQHR